MNRSNTRLIDNTARFPFDEVVACVVALVRNDWPTDARQGSVGPGVLTLARQLGAGDTGYALTLADRLGLTMDHRAFLEQAVIQLGIGGSELENIDEQPASIFQRFLPGVFINAMRGFEEPGARTGTAGQWADRRTERQSLTP